VLQPPPHPGWVPTPWLQLQKHSVQPQAGQPLELVVGQLVQRYHLMHQVACRLVGFEVNAVNVLAIACEVLQYAADSACDMLLQLSLYAASIAAWCSLLWALAALNRLGGSPPKQRSTASRQSSGRSNTRNALEPSDLRQ
jgi:hypothetical protein